LTTTAINTILTSYIKNVNQYLSFMQVGN
jgi:hypothetical protein